LALCRFTLLFFVTRLTLRLGVETKIEQNAFPIFDTLRIAIRTKFGQHPAPVHLANALWKKQRDRWFQTSSVMLSEANGRKPHCRHSATARIQSRVVAQRAR
jgi:hypothetical protein